jgi:hypothetical protein
MIGMDAIALSSGTAVSQHEVEAMLMQADKEEHIFWGKELVVSYRLRSGFTVMGRSACVDPANFDMQVGRRLCWRSAIAQLWELEGYRLQLELAGEIVNVEGMP